MRALVTTDWLALHLDDADLRVVDVRWYLDPARRGVDAYRAGHVPGASAAIRGPMGTRSRA
jgi:thiosulfate/3-mercaptopyruvate sulfurtransferase